MTERNLARFYQVAQEIWSQLPPSARFRPLEDGKVFARHASLMETWTEELVRGFYDILFGHPATRAVFREGERPAREKTLRDWYLRTLRGPFNGQYFAWQALVGLVHLRRGVTNAMMAAMWSWVTGVVAEKARESLPLEEARVLEDAFRRLAFTVMALIAEEYLEAYLEALALSGQEDPKTFVRKAQGMAATLLAQLSPA